MVIVLYAGFVMLTLQWAGPRLARLVPVWRYSVPAVAYPLIFPRVLPYYDVDIGLDILGIGAMPDDNVQVQQVLAPGTTGYTVAVPFQFVLYSQGGLPVAIVGAAVVGVLVGAAWAAVLGARPGPTQSLGGALVVAFAAFLAMDSARNAIIVSYGLAWGAPIVALLHALASGRPAARRLPG
jgi:hypothetical protein